MLAVSVVIVLAALAAGYVYLWHERQGWHGAGLATLRVIALGALVLLFVNPVRTRRVSGGAPTVLLDASLSMQSTGGQWSAAVDTALALTTRGGTVLRFGTAVAPFDTTAPEGGATRLRDALTAARARGGPTVVVTDGEIEDAASLPPALTPGTRFVMLARDTVATAAVTGVNAPQRLQRNDSLTLTLTLATWGPLAADSGVVTVAIGERRLLRTTVALPPAPGSARRTVTLPPRVLPSGPQVLRVRVEVADDQESRDDERLLVVDVSEQPAIVVVVDPPDWEGRFLVTELSDVARTTVRGFARVTPTSWLDMRTLSRVSEAQVRTAARGAGLLIVRGRRELALGRGRRPVWLWPAADPRLETFEGDWYLAPDLPVSPLAGRLAGLEWDSLAPLAGVVPLVPTQMEWVALAARQGRRGAERAVLIGKDSVGIRTLTTAGEGLWRWRFRGGAAREAYRAILAAGTDWLLADRGSAASGLLLTASPVVQRGMPIVFEWRGDSIPDSLAVTLTGDTATVTRWLRFDAGGVASVLLAPGIYQWAAPEARGARGQAAVEAYSDEFSPRAVMTAAARAGEAFTLVEDHPRGRWWLFVLAIAAFVGEWAWRQRRGLP